MGELARRRVVVHGEVQGVFFRDSTREEASRRGVAGWVTNRPDGAVEAGLRAARVTRSLRARPEVGTQLTHV